MKRLRNVINLLHINKSVNPVVTTKASADPLDKMIPGPKSLIIFPSNPNHNANIKNGIKVHAIKIKAQDKCFHLELSNHL